MIVKCQFVGRFFFPDKPSGFFLRCLFCNSAHIFLSRYNSLPIFIYYNRNPYITEICASNFIIVLTRLFLHKWKKRENRCSTICAFVSLRINVTPWGVTQPQCIARTPVHVIVFFSSFTTTLLLFIEDCMPGLSLNKSGVLYSNLFRFFGGGQSRKFPIDEKTGTEPTF